MAKLSWGIEASIGSRTTDGPTVSDANMDRFLDYLWFSFPQWVDPNDESQGLKPRNAANLAAAFDEWQQAQWTQVVADVKSWEKATAAQAAADAIGGIDE